jgi:predicted nucleotidyltransferase component of viral defense system
MNLHDNKEAFRAAIRAASDHFNIRESFVEKDYWVTFILKRLSLSDYRDKVVFKGGTSLSKVFKLIERFSEDVDLAIIKAPGQTDNSIGRLIKSIQKELVTGFSEIITANTTQYKNFRRTEYDYEHLFESESSGTNRNIVLEINSLADPVPNEKRQVNFFIALFLKETGQQDLITKYNLNSFELNVLIPQSTMIEKILSIIRLSYFPDSIDRVKRKVRHFYDIYFLATSEHCREYISTRAFKDDFERMYLEDKTKFGNPEDWLQSNYRESSVFTSFNELWDKVKSAYETDLKLLVHGTFPGEREVADKFREIINYLK